MDDISSLWREHEQAPFPAECRGKEIEGEDLVLLDSYTAGCVSTFIGPAGKLDRERHECLIGCRDGLTKVVPALAGNAKEYYERLLTLATLVLDHMEEGET